MDENYLKGGLFYFERQKKRLFSGIFSEHRMKYIDIKLLRVTNEVLKNMKKKILYSFYLIFVYKKEAFFTVYGQKTW